MSIDLQVAELEREIKRLYRLIKRLQGDQFANADRVQLRRFERGDPADNDGYFYNIATGRFELKQAPSAAGFAEQIANLIFAGPASGAAADPAFRAMVDADIPAGIARDSELHAEAHTFDSHSDVPAITEAQGQVIYWNGSNWVALAPGDSGKYLKTLGAGANPMWDAPAGGGGTLDDAYDYGGAGAGRTIYVATALPLRFLADLATDYVW